MKQILFLLLLSPLAFSHTNTKSQAHIQIAVLLDTSNSMDGLIDQARSRLWNIVNDMALTRKNGQLPKLEVALFEYGNTSISAADNYIRMVTPFTNDLDLVSEKLFGLTTNGGDEYCGAVIGEAVNELAWRQSNDDYKAIFIAGNEPFTQGKIDFRKTCQRAIAKGVMVNTIFCGPNLEGIETSWKEGADLADGQYMNIDQDQAMVAIDAPQDDQIIALGKELNKTYVSYGLTGKEKAMSQAMQDANAVNVSKESMVQRSMTKASKLYKNSTWDMVDAVEEDEAALETLKEEELPEEMRDLKPEERKAYVQKKAEKRKELQKKLGELRKEREIWIKQNHQANAKDKSLDEAMLEAIRGQLTKKSFKYKKQ